MGALCCGGDDTAKVEDAGPTRKRNAADDLTEEQIQVRDLYSLFP